MTTFRYRARNQQGEEIFGNLDAQNETFAIARLAEQGLFPVLIETGPISQSMPGKPAFWKRKKKVNTKELASFTRQFEVMFSVGMGIDKIITTLAKQATTPVFKEVLEEIQRDISGGMRLADAFAKHPQYFNKLYISMLEMGQTAGVLDKTLREMALILQKEQDIHAKIKSALLYPKIVLFTLFVVTWAMLVFVFPPFKTFYASQGAELPLPTRIVMGASDIFIAYWYLPVVIAAVVYFSWRELKALKPVQDWLSKMELIIPVFGRLNVLSSNARFGHLVAALYRVGLPLPQTLAVVANTITNSCYSKEILGLKDSIEKGYSLSKGLQDTKYFSTMVKETCAVGEQTGKLDTTLEATAKFYDSEINELLENLSTLIEPFMLFLLFGAVLLLALAVYLPIWNMSKVILH